MNKPHEPNRLTDYLTEERRQSLLEERELVEAEAQRERLEALRIHTRPLDAPEVGEEAQMPPGVCPESRLDPILPVVQSVREHPARVASRLAFGGLVDGRDNLPVDGQLPLFGTEIDGETVVWIWRTADFLEALDEACGRSRWSVADEHGFQEDAG